MGQNDGGIKRGDRADTGDLEANPTETVSRGGSVASRSGTGANTTADPSALTGGPGSNAGTAVDMSGDTILDDLTVKDAEDPTLGLTNIGDVPAEDWAADAGPGQTDETQWSTVTGKPASRASTLEGDREKPPSKRKKG
jgi:hypothetical protein